MPKRIAIVVRERQGEALRMAVGMILLDDVIDIYVLDRVVQADEKNKLYLETIADMEMAAYSTVPDNPVLQTIALEEMADRFPNYDHVLFY